LLNRPQICPLETGTAHTGAGAAEAPASIDTFEICSAVALRPRGALVGALHPPHRVLRALEAVESKAGYYRNRHHDDAEAEWGQAGVDR
jgi:hypothetical protein